MTNPFDVEPMAPTPNLAASFRVTAVLTETGKPAVSHNLYPGNSGVAWVHDGRLHTKTEVETEQGTLRLHMRAKERGTDPRRVELVASLANDQPLYPGSKLVRFDIYIETAGGVLASALAPTPEGWHPQPAIPGVVAYTWLGGTQELSSWREKFFHATVMRGSAGDLYQEIVATLLDNESLPKSFDVHRAGRAIDPATQWPQQLLTDPHGAISREHSYRLAEYPNIGSAGLHEPFGHTPWGLRSYFPLFALAAANLAGQRPYAIRVENAEHMPPGMGSTQGAYCFGVGLHWTSEYGAGHVYSRDTGRWRPSLGNSGWDGPDQEHAEALIMDAAYQTQHPAHIDKALRTARVIACAIPAPRTDRPYYFGSSFFSVRGFQRPLSVAMKACYLGNGELKYYLPLFRYWFQQALSPDFEGGLAPAHLPRRPDEVVSVNGVERWDLPIIDTWQLATKGPTFWAFRNFLLALERIGRSPSLSLRHAIERHLTKWWVYLCRAMTVRPGGKIAIYKQSLANNPAEGREPLVPGEDHGIIGWSARFLALPLERLALEQGIVTLTEADRLAEMRDRFLEQCALAYPSLSEFRTKWAWPLSIEERGAWADFTPTPIYPIETIEV